jgi:very-short-patch-repair endonuclease
MEQKRYNVSQQSLGANLAIKDKARKLRRKLTKHEKILWERIRNNKVNDLYFRRQHPYGIYILDFFCFEARLAIEVDGLIHLKQKEYDLERTKYLESSGLKVLRFTNAEVENDIEQVIDRIRGCSPFPSGGNKKGGKRHIIN